MTTETSKINIDVLTVDVKGLTKILGCGRVSATKIGEESGSRLKVGKRVLYDVEKLRAYINATSGAKG